MELFHLQSLPLPLDFGAQAAKEMYNLDFLEWCHVWFSITLVKESSKAGHTPKHKSGLLLQGRVGIKHTV